MLQMRAGGENTRYRSGLHFPAKILLLIHDDHGPSCGGQTPCPFVNGAVWKSCEKAIAVFGNVGFLHGQLDAEIIGDLANITGGEACIVVLDVVELIE